AELDAEDDEAALEEDDEAALEEDDDAALDEELPVGALLVAEPLLVLLLGAPDEESADEEASDKDEVGEA
ncbi:hypothetical protein IW150_005989, partial [Coemansia sp. RSA 2607]